MALKRADNLRKGFSESILRVLDPENGWIKLLVAR